jgi:hypothetical protein
MAARRSINKIDVIAGDVRDAAARDVFPLIRFLQPHASAVRTVRVIAGQRINGGCGQRHFHQRSARWIVDLISNRPMTDFFPAAGLLRVGRF